MSLRGLKTCVFIGELDGMVPWATDIGNAYLEAVTSEKICIRARPEFGELEGPLFIIYKALHGLRLSGNYSDSYYKNVYESSDSNSSLAESTIYMRKCPTVDHYEYVATYVDDLCIIMKNPQSLLDQLMAPLYNFKLKGSGELAFHLGCGFKRDNTNTLCMDPGKYVDRMEEAYVQHFKMKPVQRHHSPLQKEDHPELDTTPFLNEKEKDIYMCPL